MSEKHLKGKKVWKRRIAKRIPKRLFEPPNSQTQKASRQEAKRP